MTAEEGTGIYTSERAASSENPINFEQMAVKRRVILYNRKKTGNIIYACIYINTYEAIVPLIDQFYSGICNWFVYRSPPVSLVVIKLSVLYLLTTTAKF